MSYGRSIALRVMVSAYTAGFVVLVHADFRYYAAHDIDNAIGCTITATVCLFATIFLIAIPQFKDR